MRIYTEDGKMASSTTMAEKRVGEAKVREGGRAGGMDGGREGGKQGSREAGKQGRRGRESCDVTCDLACLDAF